MHAATAMSRTELHDAVEDGDVEGVRLLLEKSTDQINVRDFQGRTPAYLAAWRGLNDILSLLVLEGADINIGKNNGATPAFIAASEGHNDTLRLLVSNGADVNRTKTNIEKDSPATVAALNGNVECLRTLVQGEADMEYKNSFGKTPAIYLKERHDQDLEKIMLEERRKKATQQLRQSIRFNNADEIKRRVAEARKYNVPESKLNMLGWQSALHKALTDKKNASITRDNALLKVIWQWRAHGQGMQVAKIQEQQRRQAIIVLDAALVRCEQRVAGRCFEQWKRAAITVAAKAAAREQKGQQKRLKTALLRLNRKYAATAMLRCLDSYFSRRLFTRAFSRWRYNVVFEDTLRELRITAAQIMVRLLTRRLVKGFMMHAWSKWQASVRESKKHAERMADRQIALFRKKVERARRRTATLTVYFFAQRCASAFLSQWFTHWRYAHRVGELHWRQVGHGLLSLDAVAKRLKVRAGWHRWRFQTTLAAKAQRTRRDQQRALVILDGVAVSTLHRVKARTFQRWHSGHTLQARITEMRGVALMVLNGRLQHRWRQRGWNALVRNSLWSRIEISEEKATAAEVDLHTQIRSQSIRHAAALIVRKSHAWDKGFLSRQFQHWRHAVYKVGLEVSLFYC